MIRFNPLQPQQQPKAETSEPQSAVSQAQNAVNTSLAQVTEDDNQTQPSQQRAIQAFIKGEISSLQLMNVLIGGNTGNPMQDLFQVSTSETLFVSPQVQNSQKPEKSIPPPFSGKAATVKGAAVSIDRIEEVIQARNLDRFYIPIPHSTPPYDQELFKGREDLRRFYSPQTSSENPLAELLKQQGIGSPSKPLPTMKPSSELADDTKQLDDKLPQYELSQNPSPQEVAELARVVDDRKVLQRRIEDDARRMQQRRDDDLMEIIRQTHRDK